MSQPARGGAAVAALALVWALTGCTEPEPTGPLLPSLAPGASYTCSPPGGTPGPCTPEQYTQEQADLAIAEEAKGRYRELVAELAALQRAGGSPTPSPQLSRLAGGPYLAAQQSLLTQLSLRKATLSGAVTVKTLKAAPGAPAKGFATALFACVDATKAKIVQGATPLSTGRLVAETVYFRREGTLLKAWDAEQGDPKKC